MKPIGRTLTAFILAFALSACGHKIMPVWDIPSTLPSPTELSAVYSGQGVTLSWQYPPELMKHTRGFEVTVLSGDFFVRTVMVNGTEYSDPEGGAYNYRVKPVAVHGSSEVQSTGDIGRPAGDRELAAPGGLIAMMGLKGLKLVWDPVEGASGYSVYRKAVGDKSFRRITGKPTTATEFVDGGFLDLGGQAAYRVRASSQVRTEDGSLFAEGPASADYVTGSELLVPIAPEGLEYTLNEGSVLLYWRERTDYWAKKYRVYRSTNGGEPVELSVTLTPAYLDTTAGPGEHVYQVFYVGPTGIEGHGSPVVRVSIPKRAVIK